MIIKIDTWNWLNKIEGKKYYARLHILNILFENIYF
jgi:hypothetical protein